MNKAVAYYRVSTKRQGFSGLGLQAQKNSVWSYAKANKLKIIREFKEVESSRKANRPQLKQALEECKKFGVILLIAKLDRLARNVAFTSALMESAINFIAVDNPHATKFILHVTAAFSEFEWHQASKRTKEALAVAKSKGVVLGKYGKVLAKKNKEKSLKFARKMKPSIIKLQNKGYTSVRDISEQLNLTKIKPFKGKAYKWHPSSVFRLLKQIKE